MVRGLDEDESKFLDEVSRQQTLMEKQRREEDLKELNEYRISLALMQFVLVPLLRGGEAGRLSSTKNVPFGFFRIQLSILAVLPDRPVPTGA